jgi:hypothetical protein
MVEGEKGSVTAMSIGPDQSVYIYSLLNLLIMGFKSRLFKWFADLNHNYKVSVCSILKNKLYLPRFLSYKFQINVNN